jgi:hypothetical protein
MEAIKNTVGAIMQALKAGKGACPEAKTEAALKKVLTKRELKHIKLHYFKKGVLGIKVDSSARLYKLSLEKDKLLRALHSDLAGIKEIRFSIGETEQDGKR